MYLLRHQPTNLSRIILRGALGTWGILQRLPAKYYGEDHKKYAIW